MATILTRLIGDKKDWKRMEARATELPADYRAKLRADLDKVVQKVT